MNAKKRNIYILLNKIILLFFVGSSCDGLKKSIFLFCLRFYSGREKYFGSREKHLKWLKNELKKGQMRDDIKAIFIVGHHPLWSVGPHGGIIYIVFFFFEKSSPKLKVVLGYFFDFRTKQSFWPFGVVFFVFRTKKSFLRYFLS